MAKNMLDFEELLASNDSFLLEKNVIRKLTCEMPESLVFSTSGSTGESKYISLSRSALCLSAKTVNQHLQVQHDSCWGLVLPWWHVGGFGVITRSLVSGCKLAHWTKKWDVHEVVKWLEQENVTHLSLVPTQVFDIVAAAIKSPPLLQVVVVGGGKLDLKTGIRARELGWPILLSYGMTEASSQIATQEISTLQQPFSYHGLKPLPCWEIRTDDKNIIEVKGAPLFHGYLTENFTRYQPHNVDWYCTADKGLLTPQGLEILGRDDQLVKILGELVSPKHIENSLLAQGLAPNSISIVALEHERRGHELHLVYLASQKSEVLHALDHYHQTAEGFAKLNNLHEITAMPLSDLGKILRKQLSALVQGSQL